MPGAERQGPLSVVGECYPSHTCMGPHCSKPLSLEVSSPNPTTMAPVTSLGEMRTAPKGDVLITSLPLLSLVPPTVVSPCAGALGLGEAISCDGYRGGRLGDGKEEEGNTPSLPPWIETPRSHK